MANPILHPRYAMWAAAGLLTGCGLTLIVTHALDEDAPVPQRHAAPQERRIIHVSSSSLPMSPAVSPALRVSSSDCAESGKIRGRSTSGHCCWYGQVWSSSESQCIGTPFRCPQGHVVFDETCALQKSALRFRDVEAFLRPHQRLFRACATKHMSVYFESLWLDFAISATGQAFAVRPSPGQAWTREPHNAQVVQCVQDKLITLNFPQGHDVTHMRHVVTNTYITPELN